jgi:hypothetical protein
MTLLCSVAFSVLVLLTAGTGVQQSATSVLSVSVLTGTVTQKVQTLTLYLHVVVQTGPSQAGTGSLTAASSLSLHGLTATSCSEKEAV